MIQQKLDVWIKRKHENKQWTFLEILHVGNLLLNEQLAFDKFFVVKFGNEIWKSEDIWKLVDCLEGFSFLI
jgi:hypothetical protein